MTSRLHAFPRIDVRESPPRTAALSTWRDDWARATARAAGINAIPSAYTNGEPSAHKGGAEAFNAENARLREVFEA